MKTAGETALAKLASLTKTELAANAALVYNDSIKAWNTCVMNGDYVIANRNFQETNIALDSSASPSGVAKTGLQYLPTPLPIDMLTVSASCDRNGQYISNVNNVSGEAVVGFSYRIYDPTNPDEIDSVARISLFGRRPATPDTPMTAYNAAAAAEIVSIAQSYVDAREGGRRFAYGPNFFYSSPYPINDATGAALMECDTYVGMVLRGISYANSPFADNTPNLMYSYDTMMAETGNHSTASWCTKIRGLLTGDTAHNVLGRDVKFASDNAWLAWLQKGSVFSSAGAAKPGDLVFYKRKQSRNFDNVGHVAILGENGMIYEVTTAANSEGRVLQKIAMNEKTEQPTYFARLY